MITRYSAILAALLAVYAVSIVAVVHDSGAVRRELADARQLLAACTAAAAAAPAETDAERQARLLEAARQGRADAEAVSQAREAGGAIRRPIR